MLVLKSYSSKVFVQINPTVQPPSGIGGLPGCLPSHVGPIERLFGHARVHVAVVSGGRVHHVTVGWGLHWLLGVCLGSHHAHLHLHRVLGRLIHVAMVAVIAAVHHRLGHAVPVHGVESVHVHVHGVDIVGWRWHQVHTHVHAPLHRQSPCRTLHGYSLGTPIDL